MKLKFLLLFFLLNVCAYSQNSGIGTSSPNASSKLEVFSLDKGLLIPRVSLKSTLDTVTIANGNVNSLLVFNTQTVGDVSPGYYYWYTDRWNRLTTSSNNGLITTNGVVELGGTLTKPTVITASASNTLAVAGLSTGSSSDQVLVSDATTGVVKKIASASLIPATTVDATVLNGALTTTVNEISDSTPVNVLTSSNNGVTSINGVAELGGTLTKPTVITASATNTLAIPGLSIGSFSDQVLVTDATTGVVKKIASASIDTTLDGFIDYPSKGLVALGTMSDGKSERGQGNDFVILDDASTGIGTGTPNQSAILELKSNTRGFLPPKLTKSERDQINNPATSLVIYCTNCNNEQGCLQVNDGTADLPVWNCVSGIPQQNVTAVCNGFVSGNYVAGSALSGTYTVSIGNNSFSSATIAFDKSDLTLSGVSGVTVSSVSPTSVTILAGETKVITYNLSGMIGSAGTLSGFWKKLTLSCSKEKTVTYPDAIFNCNATNILSNDYSLVNGKSYTGSITIPYTVNVSGGTYSAQTITSNGITFTRNAGSYNAPSGNIVYNFSGTFTGNTSEIFTITTDLAAGSCTIFIFDAIRAAIVKGGNTKDLSKYDAARTQDVINVTSASYDQIAAITNASKILSSDGLFSGNPPNGTSGQNGTRPFPPVAFDTQNYFKAGSYFVAFKVKTKVPSYFSNINYLGTKIQFKDSSDTGFKDYCNPLTSLNASSYTEYYFVIKQPQNAIPTDPTLGVFNPASNNDLIGGGNNSGNFPAYLQGIEVSNKQW
ncbi:hypothetical protein [Flavobacterium humidisoli]|uniref:Uncharacterized protein n=1 Tax=Flavobacterium humidisoli TaxID=2937442 RepID=A0ABY4LXV5_9FLAO|nr:hypothetical protein [Flavobacterium humidisoli]UPZ17914.1 hypothetical protein M0M44_11310 [Flavobacterium humidisoli]